MICRRGVKEGSSSLSDPRAGENITESLVTQGREVIEDGMPGEQSTDG